VLLTLALATPVSADTFNISVGYADNLRASGFFPNPWIGATFNGQTVISQTNPASVPGGIVFDSGAVRIDNTSAVAMAISNFTITFNSTDGSKTVIAIWGAGNQLTLAPGQSGIFTQFPNNTQNFDSSDFGVFGGSPPANLLPNTLGNGGIGGCATSNPSNLTAAQKLNECNPTNAPIVSFTENGNPVSGIDTGFILDTGQYDFVNNSADGNESINWNPIGQIPNRGGSPEPASIVLVGSFFSSVAFYRMRKRRAR
jgi:hypothetical protein